LVPFPGLKEAISFAGIDLESIEPYVVPGIDANAVARVLFRAPGEETHYFVQESLSFALDLLSRLAARDDLVVVYIPRYPSQTTYLDRFSWRNKPYVLRQSVPFVSLLKSVDAVISSGGTMLREAAYLGLPAYSIFRSEIGQVDRHLESLGRLTVLESPDELPAFRPRYGKLDPLPADPALVGRLADTIVDLAAETRRRRS
jgi:predicted glycosyltransferase